MGESADYLLLLSESDQLRVRIFTDRGPIPTAFVVQYEAWISNDWRAVVRYDMAHGFVHRDVMRPDGTQRKEKIELSIRESIDYATEDISANWLRYRRTYEAWLEGRE
jgi:hypothetical protein